MNNILERLFRIRTKNNLPDQMSLQREIVLSDGTRLFSWIQGRNGRISGIGSIDSPGRVRREVIIRKSGSNIGVRVEAIRRYK